jgi:hypothetical protein
MSIRRELVSHRYQPAKLTLLQTGRTVAPMDRAVGTYYTVTGEDCNEDNEETCTTLTPYSYCCGKFSNVWPTDECLIAKLKDPHVRERILELAEDNEILVPTCSGAYVPANLVLRPHKGKSYGGL